MQHQKKRGKIFVKQFFRIKTHFFAIRGCFSQMFVLQKEFLFARGLNWDQSCLWKTPPSHFLLFSPLACPYFFNFFSSPDFWGVKEAPCKNLYVFGENWQRNQFPKLTTFLLHFSPMSPLCHSALFQIWPKKIVLLFSSHSMQSHHQQGLAHESWNLRYYQRPLVEECQYEHQKY